MTTSRITEQLESMSFGMTRAVNDVVVTRWALDRFEIGSIDGRLIISLDDAADLIRLGDTTTL